MNNVGLFLVGGGSICSFLKNCKTLFLLCAVIFALCGCFAFNSSKNGTITFTLDEASVNHILNSANLPKNARFANDIPSSTADTITTQTNPDGTTADTTGASDTATESSEHSVFLELLLLGDFEQTQTVALQKDVTVTFEEIPVESVVYLKASVYKTQTGQDGSVTKTELYTAQTEPFTVTEGENTVLLELKAVQPQDPAAPDPQDPDPAAPDPVDPIITTYTITIADGSEHGTVTVDKETAQKDELVTITVKPDAGYEINLFQLTDEEGFSATSTLECVSTAQDGTETHTFTMPEENVVLTITFVKKIPTLQDAIEDGAVVQLKYSVTQWESTSAKTLSFTYSDGKFTYDSSSSTASPIKDFSLTYNQSDASLVFVFGYDIYTYTQTFNIQSASYTITKEQTGTGATTGGSVTFTSILVNGTIIEVSNE